MRLLLLTLFAPSTADFGNCRHPPTTQPRPWLIRRTLPRAAVASACPTQHMARMDFHARATQRRARATRGAAATLPTARLLSWSTFSAARAPAHPAVLGGEGHASLDLLARANIPQTAQARGWSDVTDLDGLWQVQTDNPNRVAPFSPTLPERAEPQDEPDVLDHLRAEENVGNLTAFRAARTRCRRRLWRFAVHARRTRPRRRLRRRRRRRRLLAAGAVAAAGAWAERRVRGVTARAVLDGHGAIAACNTPAAMPIAEPVLTGSMPLYSSGRRSRRRRSPPTPPSPSPTCSITRRLAPTTPSTRRGGCRSFSSISLPPPYYPLSPATRPQPPLPPPFLATRCTTATPPRKTSRRVAFPTSDRDCFSALTSLEYRLTVSAEAAITAAAAYLVTEDVSPVGGRRRRAEPCARVRAPRRASDLATDPDGRATCAVGRCSSPDSFGGAFALRTDAAAAAARRARAVQH